MYMYVYSFVRNQANLMLLYNFSLFIIQLNLVYTHYTTYKHYTIDLNLVIQNQRRETYMKMKTNKKPNIVFKKIETKSAEESKIKFPNQRTKI